MGIREDYAAIMAEFGIPDGGLSSGEDALIFALIQERKKAAEGKAVLSNGLLGASLGDAAKLEQAAKVIVRQMPPMTSSIETHVAAKSNGALLPQERISVASTKGFPPTGSIIIRTHDEDVVVTYTGMGNDEFWLCECGRSIISTGDRVLLTDDTLRRVSILCAAGTDIDAIEVETGCGFRFRETMILVSAEVQHKDVDALVKELRAIESIKSIEVDDVEA
jgi:hypothetical protein